MICMMRTKITEDTDLSLHDLFPMTVNIKFSTLNPLTSTLYLMKPQMASFVAIIIRSREANVSSKIDVSLFAED